ncbi:MAG TPA: hypothetical protein VHM19_19110, partial [Polyangiales bacterium]|nr:hypothetical protein [Polyangiales bacterium]
MKSFAWSSIFAGLTLLCALAGCSADSDKLHRKPGTDPLNETAGSGAGNGSGGAGLDGSRGGTGGASNGGGGAGGSLSLDCPAVSQTADNQVQPVDIIIAIDTSGSMGEEIEFVQKEMNDFSKQIIDSGVDAHVILLASEGKGDAGASQANCAMAPWDPSCWGSFGDYSVCIGAPLGSGMCPKDSNPPSYTHLNVSVGSNDALSVILDSYPQWKPAVREQSVKQFLIISDDNADPFVQGETPAATAMTFVTKLKALDPSPLMFASWRMNSITCFTQCPAA